MNMTEGKKIYQTPESASNQSPAEELHSELEQLYQAGYEQKQFAAKQIAEIQAFANGRPDEQELLAEAERKYDRVVMLMSIYERKLNELSVIDINKSDTRGRQRADIERTFKELNQFTDELQNWATELMYGDSFAETDEQVVVTGEVQTETQVSNEEQLRIMEEVSVENKIKQEELAADTSEATQAEVLSASKLFEGIDINTLFHYGSAGQTPEDKELLQLRARVLSRQRLLRRQLQELSGADEANRSELLERVQHSATYIQDGVEKITGAAERGGQGQENPSTLTATYAEPAVGTGFAEPTHPAIAGTWTKEPLDQEQADRVAITEQSPENEMIVSDPHDAWDPNSPEFANVFGPVDKNIDSGLDSDAAPEKGDADQPEGRRPRSEVQEQVRAEWLEARKEAQRLSHEFNIAYQRHYQSLYEGKLKSVWNSSKTFTRELFGIRAKLPTELQDLQNAETSAQKHYIELARKMVEERRGDKFEGSALYKRYLSQLDYATAINRMKERNLAQKEAIANSPKFKTLETMKAIMKSKPAMAARIGVYGLVGLASGGLAGGVAALASIGGGVAGGLLGRWGYGKAFTGRAVRGRDNLFTKSASALDANGLENRRAELIEAMAKVDTSERRKEVAGVIGAILGGMGGRLAADSYFNAAPVVNTETPHEPVPPSAPTPVHEAVPSAPTPTPDVIHHVRAGENFWDLMEGDKAPVDQPAVFREVDPSHLQALIDLLRDKINADYSFRSAVGFRGPTAGLIYPGDTLNVSMLDTAARDIATAQGWLK